MSTLIVTLFVDCPEPESDGRLAVDEGLAEHPGPYSLHSPREEGTKQTQVNEHARRRRQTQGLPGLKSLQ